MINDIFQEFFHYDELIMNENAYICPKKQIPNKFYRGDNFDRDESVRMKLNDMIHFDFDLLNINEAKEK